MKKALSVLLAALLLAALCGCTDIVIGASNDGSTGAGGSDERVITLNGDSASYPGGGVSVNGSVVTISAPGEYTVRGTLDDGRIIIDTGENTGNVYLTLDGADITCLTDSAIYVAQAKNVDIILAAGSVNRVASGTETDLATFNALTASGAAIYAKDDLDIKGDGSLEIYGYLNNGVTCKDDLAVKGGSLRIVAANNGLRGSESVCISGGSVSISAGNDGVKSTSAKKEGKGFVEISGGELTVACGGDGVSAETELTVSGGSISVLTTGDPGYVSCKGLKAKTGLSVTGGELTVQSADHAVYSAEDMTIEGGVIHAVSGGDGLHAGKKGTGFEAATGVVTINGGQLYVSAQGDPIDAKGALIVNGGELLALGNSKSVKGFSDSSAQASLTLSADGAGGKTASIQDAAGVELASLQASYAFHTVLYSSPALNADGSYRVTVTG